MKRFEELTLEQLKQIIENSKSLRDMFDEYIQDSEFDFISDKLRCFNLNVADWSIGFYNNNYFRAEDSSVNYDFDYLLCIENSVVNFGCSDKLEKLLAQCRKLLNTNLYMYYIKKLYNLYFEEELKPIIDDVESISYELYHGEVDKAFDYLECFQDRLSGYLYDEESRTFYKPCRIAN